MSLAIDTRIEIDSWFKEQDPEDPDEKGPISPAYQFGHIYLGSRQKPVVIAAIEHRSSEDDAFCDFQAQLTTFVNERLRCGPAEPRLALGPDTEVRSIQDCCDMPSELTLEPVLQITECRYIKVDFESMVEWVQKTDVLRCSPLFHNHSRRDGVIIKCDSGELMFAQLVFTFTCTL